MNEPATTTAVAQKIDFLNRSLRPVPNPPRMHTINGWGWTIVEKYADPDLAPKFFGVYGYQMTAVSASVRAIYLLSHPVINGRTNTGSYLFHGEIPKADFERLYPGRLGQMRMKGLAITAALVAVVVVLMVIFGRR